MHRCGSRFGNKHVAPGVIGSAVIAIFAEHSTLFSISTIIPDIA
jgi:hypothetical protein